MEIQYYMNFFQLPDLLLLLAIVLILFGAKKLPEVARGFGEAVREFRRAMSETEATQKKVTKAIQQPLKEISQTTQQALQIQEDPLITAAKSKGIDVEGKTRIQIVEELAKKIKEEG